MKVLFDHQIFTTQKYGGVSKYFAEIIRRLPPKSWDLSITFSDNQYLKEYGLAQINPFPIRTPFPGRARLLSYLGMPKSICKIIKNNFDVLHQTNFHYYSNLFLHKPLVTTYHDINFLTDQNRNERMIRLQTLSLKRADKIIAISQNTRNDLLNYFDFIDPNKVVVIHHGIDTPFYNSTERLCDSPYILYVGMRHLFKNFIRFVRAFSIIAPKYKNLKVICTRYGFSNEEYYLFKKLNIEDRMLNIEASEEMLNRLYRDAELFVFPSLYEGFGMPILEAMVNGCPVALANSSCFPEIAGDAGAFFNPKEIDSIAVSISKILDDTQYRNSLIDKGYMQCKKFTWQSTADKHLEVYKSLC